MQQPLGQRQTLKWSSDQRRISPWPIGLGDTLGNQKKRKVLILSLLNSLSTSMDNNEPWNFSPNVQNSPNPYPFNNSHSSSLDMCMNNINNATTTDNPEENEKESEDSTKEACTEVAVSKQSKRGCPKGSKNKAKTSTTSLTMNRAFGMQGHVMAIANGVDIGAYVAEIGTRHRKGLCVLSGSGFVSNVNLQLPGGIIRALEGRFQMLSLNGVNLPMNDQPSFTRLTIHLAGRGGHALGGQAVGPLRASGSVLIVGIMFSDFRYETLGIEKRRLLDCSAGT